MMTAQYIIILTILAACIAYAAIRIYRAWKKVSQCHDRNYKCAGCAFYEQCKKKKKWLELIVSKDFFIIFEKRWRKIWWFQKKVVPLHSQIRNDYSTQGVLTERLGNGLQNRVERFDSARHLIKRKFFNKDFLFSYHPLPHFHSSFLGIHQNPHF